MPHTTEDAELPHFPLTREKLATICRNRSVYVVESRYYGTRYGKVALKNGRIWVNSFQSEIPSDCDILFNFKEMLFRFNKSSDLPKTVFLQLTPNRSYNEENAVDVEDDVVIIETDGLSTRAKNFRLLCSALIESSYKGLPMFGGPICFGISPGPYPVVGGMGEDDFKLPLKEGGVYGMTETNSRFAIPMKDFPIDSSHMFGVVVSGLQSLKDRQVTECGFVF